jgi:CDP-diacylglycerol--glycerol-3-phosphate 3-phosphatidyltransferase
MLNFLRPFFARLFGPIVQGLARTPVTPNMITVAGTVGVCAATLSMFPIGWLFPGAATATAFVFTDMLDGQLARIKGNSGKYGAFLDSTMDRIADAAVFGGITIWFMRSDHLLGVVSLFCLAGGMSVSYVKARAEGLGLNADVGLIERPERLIIGLTSIGLSGLGIPFVLPVGMWALAAGTAFTLYQRMRAVYVDAKSKAAQAPAARANGAQSAAAQPATAQSTTTQSATAQSTAQSTTAQSTTAQSTAAQSTTAQSATAESVAADQAPAAQPRQAPPRQAPPRQAPPAPAPTEEA